MESNDKTKFNDVFAQAASINPAQTIFAKEQMAQLLEEHFKSQDIFNNISSTGQNVHVKGGFAAEEWHTHSFNNDAILNGDTARAYNDNRTEWAQYEWKGKKLGTNDIPDTVIVDKGEVVRTYQSKYNKNVHDTTGEMSAVKDGRPKYEDVDNLLAPSDQVDAIPQQAQQNYDKNLNRGGDPVQREAYKQTSEKVTSKMTNGKSSSSDLSKTEADELGKGNLDKVKDLDSKYQSQSTFQQMGKAAAGAAAFTAVASGVMNTVTYIQMAREGKISSEDAVLKILGETASSAADSAVKASLQVGVNSYLTRSASREVATTILAKQGMGSMLRSNAVTVGVVCAVDCVKDLVKLGMGNITEKEFYERQGKNLLNTSAGVIGGSLGTSAAATAAGMLGLGSASLGYSALMLSGGLAGGLIAGMAMSLAIENGIEAPYRDLVRNTDALRDTANELMKTTKTVYLGQKLMEQFVRESAKLDNEFSQHLSEIEREQNNARNAIENLKNFKNKGGLI